MKRKKILEFASWLERQRKAVFCLSDPEFCISGYVLKWLGDRVSISEKFTLVHEFHMGEDAAMDLYIGAANKDWTKITRMDAVRALRNVAHGRKVIWEC